MRIQHRGHVNPVEGRDYLETLDPATQEVLPEVAPGGADEVDAAVAAAKAAFPRGAALPAAGRVKMMVEPGDMIGAHVPEISEIQTRDAGLMNRQTRKNLVPRAADNFCDLAETCPRVDGHTYPTPTHLNDTVCHTVGERHSLHARHRDAARLFRPVEHEADQRRLCVDTARRPGRAEARGFRRPGLCIGRDTALNPDSAVPLS